MESLAQLQRARPFSAVIVIFISMIKRLNATAWGRTRGMVDWLFLAGVNARILGQRDSAMTYCKEYPQRGSCRSPSSHPLTAFFLPNREMGTRRALLQRKKGDAADVPKNKPKGIFLMQTLISNET